MIQKIRKNLGKFNSQSLCLNLFPLHSSGIPAVNEKGERLLLFFAIIDILQT
jgi:hypothetical protein